MAKVNLDVAMESTSQEILGKVANGVKVDFRSPISVKVFATKNNNATFSGTGKGILRIHQQESNYSYVTDLVIDGVNLGKLQNSESVIAYGTIELEFTKSFSLKAVIGYERPVDVTAVFY